MENEIQSNIPQAQPLTQAPTPVSSPTNWGKRTFYILLGMIVVVGSVFVGIQIGKKQISNQQPVMEQPTFFPSQVVVKPTVVPTIKLPSEPNPTTDPTANWKTYTETQYGLSFKYQPSQVVNRNEYKSTYGGKEIVLSTEYNGNGFDWFIEENTKGVSFDAYIKDFTSQVGTVIYTGKIITIGKISGTLAEIAGYSGQLDADPAHLEFYMVGKNNKLYRIRLYTNEMVISDSDRQLFNTILESIEVK